MAAKRTGKIRPSRRRAKPRAPAPLSLRELTVRAMALRARFARIEKRRLRRAWSREEIMQGFVVDVGDLMRLVMARSGARTVPDAERKLGHELADCLWSVLVLARLYDVDLEREFVRMMDEVAAKLSRRE